MNGPKPYKFIGFGAVDVTKPCEFIWFGDSHGPKPCKFIGSRVYPGPGFTWVPGVLETLV
jgi:hypothetical protein